MTWELALQLLGGAVTLASTAFGLWRWFSGSLTELRKDLEKRIDAVRLHGDERSEKREDQHRLAESALSASDRLIQSQLQEFKLEVAQTYVSNDALERWNEQMVRAMEAGFARLDEKINLLLARRAN